MFTRLAYTEDGSATELQVEAAEQVSVTRGDGEGFDVLSFSRPDKRRLIEVKTTSYGVYTPFFVTRNELEVSRATSDEYHVYGVYAFRKQPKLYLLPGAIDATSTWTQRSTLPQ